MDHAIDQAGREAVLPRGIFQGKVSSFPPLALIFLLLGTFCSETRYFAEYSNSEALTMMLSAHYFFIEVTFTKIKAPQFIKKLNWKQFNHKPNRCKIPAEPFKHEIRTFLLQQSPRLSLRQQSQCLPTLGYLIKNP